MTLIYHQPRPRKTLTIEQDVLADQPLIVDSDLHVKGAIRLGSLVRASGSIRVEGNVEGAKLWCAGELTVPAGAIFGGQISATAGIHCLDAGDCRGTPTELTIGLDETLLEFAERRIVEIETTREKVARFRTTLEPMLKQGKTLTAGQKEQLTELLSQTLEAEKRATSATVQLRTRLADITARPSRPCVVGQQLFQNVKFVYPGMAAEVVSNSNGPIEIISGSSRTGMAVQARHRDTGKSIPLRPVPHECRVGQLLARLGPG